MSISSEATFFEIELYIIFASKDKKVTSSMVFSVQVPFWEPRFRKQTACNTNGVSVAPGPLRCGQPYLGDVRHDGCCHFFVCF